MVKSVTGKRIARAVKGWRTCVIHLIYSCKSGRQFQPTVKLAHQARSTSLSRHRRIATVLFQLAWSPKCSLHLWARGTEIGSELWVLRICRSTSRITHWIMSKSSCRMCLPAGLSSPTQNCHFDWESRNRKESPVLIIIKPSKMVIGTLWSMRWLKNFETVMIYMKINK